MNSSLIYISTIRIMLPFGFGYLLSYFSRNISAILAEDLSMEFAINANSLGLLTSTYFLAFAICQLPLGVLLDRFSPSRVEAAFLSIATLGAILSAMADNAALLSLGRICMGFGVSACLMASYRAIIDHFPTHQIPMMNSVILAFGGLGAIISGWQPTTGFIEDFGWRNIFIVLTVGFTLCIILLLFVAPIPERLRTKVTHDDEDMEEATDDEAPPPISMVNGLTNIIFSRHFWHLMPVAAMTQGIMLAINSLWIVPWLMHTDGFSFQQSSYIIVFISATMVAGQLLAGWLGTQAGGGFNDLRKLFLIGVILSICALALISLRTEIPAFLLWGSFTLFAPFAMLAYPMMVQKFPPELSGRVITLLNFSVFFCAFIFQWMIGAIIGAIDSQSLEVDLLRFQIAFGIPAFLCLISLLCMVIVEATNENAKL